MGFLPGSALANTGKLKLPVYHDGTFELVVSGDADNLDPKSVIQVYVGDPAECCADKSPMAGQYSFNNNTVVFAPSFDLINGQIYTVLTRDSTANGPSQTTLTPLIISPDLDRPQAQVTAIYPSADALPENTLRFYIHFSAAMQPHKSAEFIQLIDHETGQHDAQAFMAFKQELWSRDRKRLTLLMDPGRIKRGVAQNLELGPALLEGKTYSIVVNEGWPSATGAQKIESFSKPFTVTAALRTLPDTKYWAVEPPRSFTTEPLTITFDRPFDHVLAQTSIAVTDAAGQTIDGSVALAGNETVWRFTPARPWTGQNVQLVVDATMEDVASNNFRDLLDHAAGTEIQNIDHHTINVTLLPEPN